MGTILGLFVDVGGETFEVESVFRVAVSDAGVELDDVAGAVFDFADNFGLDVRIGGNWPVHIGNGDTGVRLGSTALGVEEVEVDDVAGFQAKVVSGGLWRAGAGVFDLIIIHVVAEIAGIHDVLDAARRISDVINGGDDIAVCVDAEATFGVHVEAAEIEDELAVQEDPNVVIAAKPELFAAVGGDFHRNPHVGGEMEVVASCGGFVVF